MLLDLHLNRPLGDSGSREFAHDVVSVYVCDVLACLVVAWNTMVPPAVMVNYGQEHKKNKMA